MRNLSATGIGYKHPCRAFVLKCTLDERKERRLAYYPQNPALSGSCVYAKVRVCYDFGR